MNRAAVKTMSILECLVRHKGGLNLTQLAQSLGIPVSTAHELVSTLVELGYLQYDPELRRYEIGFKLLDLGQAYLHEMEIYLAATPFLGQVSRALDCVASVYVFDRAEDMVLALAEEGGAAHLRLIWRLGRQSTLHCSAPGKVFLAALKDEEVERLLARLGMAQFTPNTITDLARLRLELDNVREHGYGLDREEVLPGIGCMAVPIVANGSQIGALSVHMAYERLQSDWISRAFEILSSTAASIANGVARLTRSQATALAPASALPQTV